MHVNSVLVACCDYIFMKVIDSLDYTSFASEALATGGNFTTVTRYETPVPQIACGPVLVSRQGYFHREYLFLHKCDLVLGF